jgi:hypothetical protein
LIPQKKRSLPQVVDQRLAMLAKQLNQNEGRARIRRAKISDIPSCNRETQYEQVFHLAVTNRENGRGNHELASQQSGSITCDNTGRGAEWFAVGQHAFFRRTNNAQYTSRKRAGARPVLKRQRHPLDFP